MELTVFLAWTVLLVGLPLNLIAVYQLRRKSREAPQLQVLRERFVVAVAGTLLVVFFGIIFVNNDQTEPWLSLDTTKVITRLAMLGFSLVAAGYWLWLYRTTRSREPDNR